MNLIGCMGGGLGEVRMEIDRERRMKRFEHSASHQMSSFLLFYLNSISISHILSP